MPGHRLPSLETVDNLATPRPGGRRCRCHAPRVHWGLARPGPWATKMKMSLATEACEAMTKAHTVRALRELAPFSRQRAPPLGIGQRI